jgi:hypothetical protein
MFDATSGQTESESGSFISVAADAKFVLIPDAALLFAADFKKSGPDLVLHGSDGHRAVVVDYFKTDAAVPLVAPNGASLSPQAIELLSGAHTHAQYAQAGAAPPPAPIGSVKALIGHVTVVRNGVEVALNVGDAIYKSDIVQTAGGSAVGISFPDGTALHLTGNTRMALSDYNFETGGSTNGAFFHLIDGTFSFVAGQVAKTGGLKIETPSATVGIRGTTGWIREVATISATFGNATYSFAVVNDQNTDHSGIYDLIDSNGNVFATVSEKGIVTFVTGQGIGLPPLVTTQAITAEQAAFEQQIIQAVFNVVNGGMSPRFDPGHDGSYQSPPTFEQHNQLYNPDDHSTTFTLTLPGDDGPVTGTVKVVFTPPVLPVLTDAANHSPTIDPGTLISVRSNEASPSGQTIGSIFSGKFHDTDPGASLAGIAVAGNTANPSTQGVWQYSVNGGSLWIDIGSVSASAALALSADTLLRFVPAHNFYGEPPPLVVYGIDNSYSGSFTSGILQIDIDAASGGGASPVSATPVEIVTSVGADVWNKTDGGDWGTGPNWTSDVPGESAVVIIDLPAGQTVAFDGGGTPVSGTIAKLVNTGGGTLEVTDLATLHVQGPADNAGIIKASDGGTVSFEQAEVQNQDGTITAVGCGSEVDITGSLVLNGLIEAKWGGFVSIDTSTIDNTHNGANDGVIDANGHCSVVDLYDAHVIGGTLQTEHGGVIEVESGSAAGGTVFDGSQSDGHGGVFAVTLDGHIEVTDCSVLTLMGHIHNYGQIGLDSDSQLAVDGEVRLDGGGKVHLDGADSSILGSADGSHNVLTNVDNHISGSGSIGDGCDSDFKLVNESCGVIDANDRCDSLTIDTGWHQIVNAGTLEATHGGSLVIDSDVDNSCGLIEAGARSYVSVLGDVYHGDALIKGGTLEYDGCSNVDTAFACNSAGTLVLGADSHFTGTVTGFDADDRIDFKGLDFTNCTDVVYCDGTLTVTSGSESSSVKLDGDYGDTHFVVFDDGCGNAEVATAPQANGDHIIASYSALDDCSTLTLPSEVLLSNDSDAIRGDELTIKHAHSGDNTCVSGPDCNGDIAVKFDDAGDGGTFSYTTKDSYHLYSNACVDVSFQCGALEGTCDNEIIPPGSQSACLTGGGGSDTFLFASNVATGNYNVTDFTTHSQGWGGGADVIDLENFSNIQDFQDVLCNAHESGCDTVISLGCNNSITLQNVHIADLSSADFAIQHAAACTP